MDIEEIVDHVTGLGGVLVLRPQPGDGTPDIAWGDVFFYYAPDGRLPHGQPFATIVTKSYPDEEPDPALARAGSFRLNVDVGRVTAADVVPARTPTGESAVGAPPVAGTAAAGTTGPDTWILHPVHGGLGWVAVVDPGERTAQRARELLAAAHASARARRERRDGVAASP